MKIAMIGASGFVGTRLLGLLCEEGEKYECKNIDLLPSHFFNDITVIGDVREQEHMDRELKGADVVILLAAQHRDDVSPVSLYYDTNVGGMEVTLRAMEKNGVKRIIFFSSVAVYGLNKKNPDDASKSIELILDTVCASITEGLEERKVEKADEKAAGENADAPRRDRRRVSRKDENEAEVAAEPAAEAE